MSLSTELGYVNKFNSVSSKSLKNTPAVRLVVSFIGALIRNSWVVTSVFVVESTSKFGAPQVPVGTLPGANFVYVT